MPELQDQVAIITGASSGIGKAVSKAFSRAGAQVVLASRSEKDLKEVAEGLNGNALIVPTDVTEEDDRKRLIEKTVGEFGKLNVLVNSAGIIGFGTLENTKLEDWDTIFNINVRSVFRLMQLAIPHLVKTRGNIVNVSSLTGVRAFPGVLAYCASKSALDQLTRCASLELASRGVRVNAVNPGVVQTQLHRRSGMNEEDYARFLEQTKNNHPLGKLGQPEEIAELILFLASDKAAWITGATYSVDGGRFNKC